MEIIKFYQDGCKPCAAVSQFFKVNAPDVTIKEINVAEAPDQAAKYGIMGVPVTLLLDGESIVKRTTGFNGEELYEMIEAVQGK